MNFTAQETLIGIIMLVATIVIIGLIFKTLLKIAVVAACIVFIFGLGFG